MYFIAKILLYMCLIRVFFGKPLTRVGKSDIINTQHKFIFPQKYTSLVEVYLFALHKSFAGIWKIVLQQSEGDIFTGCCFVLRIGTFLLIRRVYEETVAHFTCMSLCGDDIGV